MAQLENSGCRFLSNNFHFFAIFQKILVFLNFLPNQTTVLLYTLEDCENLLNRKQCTVL